MRLGLHLHYADEGSHEEQLARRYVERVRPPMIKVLNNAFNPSFLRFCREQGTEIVGRLLLDNEDQDWDTRPALRAIEAAVRANPDIGWWEFYNEYERIQDLDDMEKYAEICIEFMEMMEALGKHGLIGSFGTGSPEPEEWERYAPAVQHAWTHGHGLCLHEYSAPDLRYGCGANQWNDEHKTAVLDDPCLDPAVLGNLTLRYRRVLAQFHDRIQAWGATPRIFLGETGNDDITMAPGGGGKGYRSWYGSEWLLGDYADQMRWYCWQLSHDPAIIGLVDFGWGTVAKEPDDDKWHSFDLAAPEEEQMLERLTELQLTVPREHVAPGATLTPPPPHRLPPWRPGDTVRPLHAVNFRREPGIVDKPADDVVRVVRKGAHLTVRPGLPREVDGLLWWSLAHGAGEKALPGWMAEAVGDGTRLLEPARPAPPFAMGEKIANITWHPLNAWPTPGFQSEVPGAAGFRSRDPDQLLRPLVAPGEALTVIDGPVERDGLTWWQVRFAAPRTTKRKDEHGAVTEETVDTGWVAEMRMGEVLLGRG